VGNRREEEREACILRPLDAVTAYDNDDGDEIVPTAVFISNAVYELLFIFG